MIARDPQNPQEARPSRRVEWPLELWLQYERDQLAAIERFGPDDRWVKTIGPRVLAMADHNIRRLGGRDG